VSSNYTKAVSSTVQLVEHHLIMLSLLLVMVVKTEKITTSLETPGVLLGVTKDTSRSLLLLVLVSAVSNRFLSIQLLLEKLKNYLI
jgi:hypothetical protein